MQERLVRVIGTPDFAPNGQRIANDITAGKFFKQNKVRAEFVPVSSIDELNRALAGANGAALQFHQMHSDKNGVDTWNGKLYLRTDPVREGEERGVDHWIWYKNIYTMAKESNVLAGVTFCGQEHIGKPYSKEHEGNGYTEWNQIAWDIAMGFALENAKKR